MDLDVELRGVDVLIEANETFRRRLPFNVLSSLRQQVNRTIATVKKDIAQRSTFGRKIWGKNPKGLDKQVTFIKFRVTADGGVETGIKLVGIPRLLEDGGRIKEHTIRGNPFLIFSAPWAKGLAVIAKKVNHPGGPVPARRFAAQAMERDSGSALAEVSAGVNRLIGEVFGKSA